MPLWARKPSELEPRARLPLRLCLPKLPWVFGMTPPWEQHVEKPELLGYISPQTTKGQHPLCLS